MDIRKLLTFKANEPLEWSGEKGNGPIDRHTIETQQKKNEKIFWANNI